MFLDVCEGGEAKLSTSQKIAAALGETEKAPLATIERLIKIIGEERAQALLDEALKVEAEGGMLTDDGSKRRTPGGVFFKLAKNRTASRERWLIFSSTRPTKPKPKPQPITWAESEHLSNEALKLPKGEASTVKVTIIGRPGRIIEKEGVVITSMQNSAPPSLPKALPKPPGDPTPYIVYISMKQWKKVRQSIQDNPEDKLIVEGYPVFDKRIGQHGAMTIYAQNTTTTLIQQARREAQKAAAE
jgi:hypothetical protein